MGWNGGAMFQGVDPECGGVGFIVGVRSQGRIWPDPWTTYL